MNAYCRVGLVSSAISVLGLCGAWAQQAGSTADLAAFCARLDGQAFVAVDTEFMRETTYWPKLCLFQAAAPGGIEATIDPLAEGLDLTPFLAVMRDKSVLKVFHAARQDVEIFNNLGAMPGPLFDTQIRSCWSMPR